MGEPISGPQHPYLGDLSELRAKGSESVSRKQTAGIMPCAVPQLEWTPGRGYVEPLRGGGEWGNFAGAPMGAGI